MARLVYTAAALLAVASFAVASAQETSFASEQGNDTCDLALGEDACVPATCCHATQCVSREFAPNCTGVPCTLECRGGTMDCGGYCECAPRSEGGARCRAIYVSIPTPPNDTVTEPSVPPTPPAADTCDVSVGDSDCVPATCCHATECVSRAFKPDCTTVLCSAECRPGTLDCGQGYCACTQDANGTSRCGVMWASTVSETSEETTVPVLTTDAEQTITDPPVSNPETTLDETTIPVGTTEPSATVTEPEPTAIPTTAVSTSRPPTGNGAPSTAVTFSLVGVTLLAAFSMSL